MEELNMYLSCTIYVDGSKIYNDPVTFSVTDDTISDFAREQSLNLGTPSISFTEARTASGTEIKDVEVKRVREFADQLLILYFTSTTATTTAATTTTATPPTTTTPVIASTEDNIKWSDGIFTENIETQTKNNGDDDNGEIALFDEELKAAEAEVNQNLEAAKTITARCRKRIEWANAISRQEEGEEKEAKEEKEDWWVCSQPNCNREVCKHYRDVCEANEQLNKARSAEMQGQFSSDDPVAGVEYSEREKALAQRIRAMEAEYVELKKENVASKKENVASKKNILQGKCDLLLEKHTRIKDMILQGANAGNKTTYVTACTDREKLDKEACAHDILRPTMAAQQQQTSPSSWTKMMEGAEEVKPVDAMISSDWESKLCEFYTFCETLFLTGVPVPDNIGYFKPDFASHIKTMTDCILGWSKGKSVDTQEAHYIPSHIGQETRAVQPILLALMWKISNILGGNMHLTREQFIPLNQASKKSTRWIDFACIRGLLGKSVEIKPVGRQGEKFPALVDGGGDQVLGHSCQIVHDSHFQFCGGLGRDGAADGIVLTMASVQYHSVTLEGVGTTDIKVEKKQSRNEPLFSEKVTLNLFGNQSKSLEDSGLVFEKPSEAGTAVLQPGFKRLVDFVMNSQGNPELTTSTKCELHGEKQGAVTPVSLGRFLGAGAFCSVYAATVESSEEEQPVSENEKKQIILEFSKDNEVHSLKNEVAILRALHDKASETEPIPMSIPRLMYQSLELSKLKVSQRCEATLTSCMALDMSEGKSARDVARRLQSDPTKNNAFVEAVFTTIDGALDYSHANDIHHMDVNPSNILPVSGEEIYLIDWGSAANVKKGGKITKVQGFRGTPPFAHPNVLAAVAHDKKWTPVPMYDKFSLALTVASLLSGGEVPWPGFHRPIADDEHIKERATIAKKIIEDAKLCDTVSKKAIEYLESRRPRRARSKKGNEMKSTVSSQLERKRKGKELKGNSLKRARRSES